MSDTLYEQAQTAQQKVFSGMVTVSFGALALSMQFSPRMGKELWWSLILSWALFFISAIAGGWRLSKESVFLRQNYKKLTAANAASAAIFDGLMKQNQPVIARLAEVQTWTLVGGLFSGLIFVAANYVHCVFSSCPTIGGAN